MVERTSVNPPCPGTRQNFLRLSNEFTTPFGIGHPANTGECKLFLHGLDENGELTDAQLVLAPGDSANWFQASPGSVSIVLSCSSDCGGFGELSFDLPVA
jgi:hypothetical protein